MSGGNPISWEAWEHAIRSMWVGAHVPCAVAARTASNPRRWSWGIGQHPKRLAALLAPGHARTGAGAGLLARWERWAVEESYRSVPGGACGMIRWGGALLHRPYGELAIDGEPMRFDAVGPSSGTSDAEEEAIRDGMLAVDAWARERNWSMVAYMGAMTRSPVLAEYARLDAEEGPIESVLPPVGIGERWGGWSEPAMRALAWAGRCLGILNALDWDIGIDASAQPVSELATQVLAVLRAACRSQGRRLLVEGPLPLAHAAMLVHEWPLDRSAEPIGSECVWSIRSMRASRAHGSKGLPARHAMIDALCQGHPIVVDGIPHRPDEAAVLAYLAYEAVARDQPTRMWALRALEQHTSLAAMRERALDIAALWRATDGHPASRGWEWWTITPGTPAGRAVAC